MDVWLPLQKEGKRASSGPITFYFFKKKPRGGFPGGAGVKNLPANAGDTGSIPGPGRSHMLQSIPHAAERLSPCATTTEPAL